MSRIITAHITVIEFDYFKLFLVGIKMVIQLDNQFLFLLHSSYLCKQDCH